MKVLVQTSYKYKIEMEQCEVDLLVDLLDKLPSNGMLLSQDELELIDRFVFRTRQALTDQG